MDGMSGNLFPTRIAMTYSRMFLQVVYSTRVAHYHGGAYCYYDYKYKFVVYQPTAGVVLCNRYSVRYSIILLLLFLSYIEILP